MWKLVCIGVLLLARMAAAESLAAPPSPGPARALEPPSPAPTPPAPEPQPAPRPLLAPEPQPAPTPPAPEPQPAPRPLLAPEPQPAPRPLLAPEPQPAPTPPAPEPQPAPTPPAPEPAPAPRPLPPPASAPVPRLPEPQPAAAQASPPPASAQPTAALPPAPAPPAAPRRLGWALQLDLASGVYPDEFGNSILGGHLDWAFARSLSLGGYLGLANLKGKDRRVTVLLPCVLLSHEEPPAAGRSISYPLRFAGGYLARNGPVARLGAGMAWAAGRTWDVVVDLAPMAWVTHEQLVLSLNLGLEIRFRAESR